MTKRNREGAWMREIEKCIRRFDSSFELFVDRVNMRDEELKAIKENGEMESHEKDQLIQAKRMESIRGVIEDVEVLVDAHFFNEFSIIKSSLFLKRVISNLRVIDVRLFKKTWRTTNCNQKTSKIIREIQENLLCVGKMKELVIKQKTDSRCWCSKTGLPLNAKLIVSCCKASGEINTRHDIVVNILLNNILVQRGLISHEQNWEDRKTVRTAHDEITTGTEHRRSDELKEKGRVSGARLRPDLVWLRRVSGGQWRKVVVDVKVRSTDKLNESFKKKDDKYRDWTTKETREK